MNKKSVRQRQTDIKKQPDKEDRGKQLMMWSGVIFFMILFVFIWSFNIRASFRQVNEDWNNSEKANQDWEDLSAGINNIVDDIREGLDNLKDYSATSSPETTANGLAADEKIEELKIKLEETSTSTNFN